MKRITYNGPLPASPPVEVALARELSLPKGKAIEVDDDTAAKLLQALPGAFLVEGEPLAVSAATGPSAPIPDANQEATVAASAAKQDPTATGKGGKP